MQFPYARILVFAKAPVPGLVKTRLISVVGKDKSAALYVELLSGVIHRLAGVTAPLQLWCTPNSDHPFFHAIDQSRGVTLHIQQGDNLGQRMAYAARSALKEAGSVVLIGGDCPVLEKEHLNQALTWLAEGSDAVLGPAEDGGYVLLALKQMNDHLFEQIAWGGDDVCELTRQRLRALNWAWQELDPLWDVDRKDDLLRYRKLCAD
jgi:rSAM/selenodomain-associated transferase 1